MPIFQLSDDSVAFPPAGLADPPGLLAVGGDLQPERLLTAYQAGIFPWFEDGQPILWWSPDPRTILDPKQLHVPRSLRKAIRQASFEIRLDSAFEDVVRSCRGARRRDQAGTWITEEMVRAYVRLHEEGFAHSAEAWRDGKLVGGLYGVSLGRCFFGESMFSVENDSSKVAFVVLVNQLVEWEFDLVDCQVKTDHLERFGAREVSRRAFLARLESSLAHPTRRGPWQLATTPRPG